MKTPTFSFSMPLQLKRRIEEYKAKKEQEGLKVSMSAVICFLLETALRIEESK